MVCDTIEQRLDLTLVPGIGFPVAVRTVWYVPAAQPAGYTRTPAEAEALAYLELSRRIAAIPGGAELLSKTVCPILTEDAFILDVTLTCVEDIALFGADPGGRVGTAASRTTIQETEVYMNQRSIKMDNAAVTAALFGSFDVNTRILENRFGVSLHNRSDGDGGDAVLISGESPEAVNAAATAVEYLRDMLRLSDSLNEQTVRYVADTVAEGRASELTSLSPDIICLTAKGKPVKAKTAGQSKYVEAIRQNTVVLGVGPAGTGKTFLAVAMAVKALREKRGSAHYSDPSRD